MLSRVLGVGLILAASAALGQPTAIAPAFEVATIKPAEPITPALVASGKLHVGMRIDQARVDIGYMSLADLLPLAYRVKPYQISGPGWMSAQRFDVLAKMPEGATKEQAPEMLQALLVERFKLTMHRESKEHSVYALTVAKGGPKLKESAPDADTPAADTGKGSVAIGTSNGPVRVNTDGKGTVVSGGPNGTTRMSMQPGGVMRLETSKMTMAGFADMLSRFVDRPVVDVTELKGPYQVAVEISMEELRNVAAKAGVGMPGMPGAPGGEAGRPPASPADAATDPSGSSIFAAVQQLGLKLEPRKAPIELIVIDHLEKTPTEN